MAIKRTTEKTEATEKCLSVRIRGICGKKNGRGTQTLPDLIFPYKSLCWHRW